MPKKRLPRKAHFHGPRHSGKIRDGNPAESLDNDILALLYKSIAPVSVNDIAQELAASDSDKKYIEKSLGMLLQENSIKKSGKRQFALSKSALMYEGILEQNPRGFGFVSQRTSMIDSPSLSKDPFIPASRLKSARQGDKVLIRAQRLRSDDRPEASVVKILARGTEKLAGFFSHDARGGMVVPEDLRFSFTVLVDPNAHPELRNGDAVIVKIDPADQSFRTVRGEIVEILGSPDNIDVQMRMVIQKFNLPHIFSPEAEQEAAMLPEEIIAEQGREDLRKILHVTIDGETAKDFDDAVAVTRTRKGFRLYVSIADVSHFVTPGTALDKDAYERGTSIYFPGRVIPMLPEKLSNNLCSLVPHLDRLALTAILDFDRAGELLDKRFTRSIIRSHQRFTYTTVRKILIDKDAEMCTTHKSFLAPLKVAGELAKALQKMRRQRGALGFTLPEAEIELDNDGRIAAIKRAERNFAHQMIEEFMLAANEAVAATFTEQKRKSLYRIHERPDPEKVREFSIFAKSLGLQLPEVENSPHWFAMVLDLCKGSPKEYIVNNLLLRTMQQARYSPENVGHFGLAATDYTHFTSPIRRYPDLMVHRELCRMFGANAHSMHAKDTSLSLKEAGDFLSGRERASVNAEREMSDRLKLLYMEKHLGETFSAIISGVNESVFFVELLDLFISGSIAVEDLSGDHYFFDARHHRLTGEIGRKVFQLGDTLQVVAISVDRGRNRISFEPLMDADK